MAITSRPAQHKQSSRKGKKAWRKNIDLTDIEQSIETKKELEITHGTDDITNLKNESLFAVDVSGDEILKEKLIKRKQIKKNLKSNEILESIKTNSKVNALLHHKHNGSSKIPHTFDDGRKKKGKVQGVSKKEINKLMTLAGKNIGESKLQNRVAKEGLVKSNSFDLWGNNDTTTPSGKKSVQLPSGIKVDIHNTDKNKKNIIPEELLSKSTTGWSIASVIPNSLKQKPVQVREFEELPHAGKSYNPNKRDWSDLIDKEFKIEQVRENNRLALEEYRKRIEHLMETIDDNEESSSDEDNDDDDDVEEEEDDDSNDIIRLSINAPIKNKKKTKYQRNKAKRHEEKVKLQQELKKLREQVKELEKIEDIEKEIVSNIDDAETEPVEKKRKHNRNKLGSKYGILEEKLEVKFSDELSDSLRKLRPEGNLLYENVRKLQSAGKVESRIHIKRGRRYKQKITEKWTHKDFK